MDVRVSVSFVSTCLGELALSAIAKAHNVHQSYSLGVRVATYCPCDSCHNRRVCQLFTGHQVKLDVHLIPPALLELQQLYRLVHRDAGGDGYLAIREGI